MRINFEKCTVLLRNQQLVRLAYRYIGETTSKVFQALLRSIENKLVRCWDPLDSDVRLFSREENNSKQFLVSPETILKYLDPDLDLNNGLYSQPTMNGVNGHSQLQKPKAPTTNGNTSTAEKESIPSLKRKASANSNELTFKIISHLKILERDPRRFVIFVEGKWTVPFKSLTRLLIQHEIENTITARFGPVSARLIRILHKNHSTDEKALASAAILKPKEVRAATNALLAAGLLATHEIPRDSNRTTNRLLWLYAYDPISVRARLIRDSYAAMLRLLRRADVEKERMSGLLQKAERTDVVGKEDIYLTSDERRELWKVREMEMDLLGHVGRIDDLVACLRYFAHLKDPYIGNRPRPEAELVEEEEAEE
jgi:DNA-directed RNA polymerase III subunit RPC3